MTTSTANSLEQRVIPVGSLLPTPSVFAWEGDQDTAIAQRMQKFVDRANERGLRVCALFGDGLGGPTHAVVESFETDAEQS